MTNRLAVLLLLAMAPAVADAQQPSSDPVPIKSNAAPVILDSTIYDSTSVDVPARIIKAGKRQYPSLLESRGVSGIVVGKVIIDTLGQPVPSSYHTLQASDTGFEAAAKAMILDSRFSPAKKDGRLVAAWVVQRVRFEP